MCATRKCLISVALWLHATVTQPTPRRDECNLRPNARRCNVRTSFARVCIARIRADPRASVHVHRMYKNPEEKRYLAWVMVMVPPPLVPVPSLLLLMLLSLRPAVTSCSGSPSSSRIRRRRLIKGVNEGGVLLCRFRLIVTGIRAAYPILPGRRAMSAIFHCNNNKRGRMELRAMWFLGKDALRGMHYLQTKNRCYNAEKMSSFWFVF